MAGRGTDIVLGGAAKGLVKSIVKQLLLVQLGLTEIPSISETESESTTSTTESTPITNASEEDSLGKQSIMRLRYHQYEPFSCIR